MKNSLISFFFYIFVAQMSCFAEAPPVFKETEPTTVVKNELKHLDHLIAMTEKSVENQKALRQQFLQYQQLQEKYLQNTQDQEVTLKFVNAAYRLLESIKINQMMQTFDAEFISQLTFFSQFAKCK